MIIEVYITKHCLTKGIRKLTVEWQKDSNIVQTLDFTYKKYFHGEGKDWHRQEWQAVAAANDIRDKKIRSLEKSVEKLKKLRF